MISSERFDGAAHWARLSPEQQAEIGAIALEVVCCSLPEALDDDFAEIPTALDRAGTTAGLALIAALEDAFAQVVPREALVGSDGMPLLPSRAGPFCRECGCSDDDACMPACSWVEPDLCSACQIKEA